MTRKSLPCFSDFASRKVLNVLQPKSEIARDNLRFLTIPDTFKSSNTIVWFSRMSWVDNLCRKSVRVSATLAWSLANRFRENSCRLDPLVFRDRDLDNFFSFLILSFRGLGAFIFCPLLRVAKVEIPRSIPTELSEDGKTSGWTSTTKLRKYRSELSLMIVTELGSEGNSLVQTTLSFPTFAK